MLKLTPGMDPVHKISIIPRGPALGLHASASDGRSVSHRAAPTLKNRLYVLLGGRAAEELIFKEITTGACDDLSKSTDLAQRMVTEFGMSDKMGPLTFRRQRRKK